MLNQKRELLDMNADHIELSSLNCFLVLALAANSPHLGHLAADIDSNHQAVVEVLEPWARPGSSIEHALEIANSVARKLRLRDDRRRY